MTAWLYIKAHGQIIPPKHHLNYYKIFQATLTTVQNDLSLKIKLYPVLHTWLPTFKHSLSTEASHRYHIFPQLSIFSSLTAHVSGVFSHYLTRESTA